MGRAARRADLDGAPGPAVGRSTLRQALDAAARLDVRTYLDGAPGPAVGRSTLDQALDVAARLDVRTLDGAPGRGVGARRGQRGSTCAGALPTAVWINRPPTLARQEAPGTTIVTPDDPQHGVIGQPPPIIDDRSVTLVTSVESLP